MKTILWGNYKGGVGKTTSVFQVATYFAEAGKKVLLVDMDPQCSLSNICCNSNSCSLSDYEAENVFNYVVELYMRYINSKQDIDFSLLMGQLNSPIQNILKAKCVELKNSIYKNNLFFIPSSISFENCRLNELAQRMEKNIYNIFLLHLLVKDIEHLDFDYLFIDCPPTSNILIQSAFLESDFYIVPTIVDGISAKGVADYISEIEKTRMKYTMNEKIGGILINKVFGNKAQLIGVFETIYKERRGNADNRDEIITLDKNIERISNVNALISDNKYKDFRYSKSINGFETKNIFNDLYFVALSAALTLPDICGKAEYPGEKSSKKRYIDWYDKEIGYYEKNPHQTTDEEMPYLSGSVIYSLRCSLLHEGNPNVDNDRLTKRNESLPIDHFVLKIERKNDFDIYSDGSGISDMFDQHSRSYRMSIRRVCLLICCVAEAYYKENKEKFHFNYEILDWDKATEHLPPIDMEAFMKALADPNLGE